MYYCLQCGYRGAKDLWKPFISCFDNEMIYCTCPSCDRATGDPVDISSGKG